MHKILNMKRWWLLFLIAIINHWSYGQSIQGKVSSESGEPIPFSTIYVSELSYGAAANAEGEFKLNVPAGTYTCVFQSLGYQPLIRDVEAGDDNQQISITLSPLIYDLSPVEISGKREDPAYDVMRQLIARAPDLANIIDHYSATVYIKGTLHVESISPLIKRLYGDELEQYHLDDDSWFLQESVNEVDFKAPRTTRQKVVSMKSNFPDFGGDQSQNALGFISGNIYRPNGFGAAFSPIYPGAFIYYRYRHEGTSTVAGYKIHKVAILPKGKGAQYVEGTLYIIDGLWCLSSLEIFKEEQMGVGLDLYQNYSPVKDSVWMPVSNRMKVDVDLLGIKGSFDYHSSIRYNELEIKKPRTIAAVQTPEKSLAKKEADYFRKSKSKIERKEQKIAELSGKELTDRKAYRISRLKQQQSTIKLKDSLRFNHVYTENFKIIADSSSIVHDTSYWNEVRPIPLSDNEIGSIRVSDSLTVAASDSSGKEVNGGFAFGNLILGGDLYTDDNTTFRTKGVLNPFSMQFNVVDGLKFHTLFTLEQKMRSGGVLSLQPMLGYAFARKSLYGEALLLYTAANTNKIGLRYGQQTVDYNPDGIHHFESTIEGLIFRENPARFYYAEYADLVGSVKIARGLHLTPGLFFSRNKSIENHSDYSIFFRESKDYRPNVPEHKNYVMESHRDLSLELTLKYKPIRYFYVKDGLEVPYGNLNTTPEFTLSWRKGLPILDTDYDLLSFSIQHSIPIGGRNEINYKFDAGYFINTGSMWFSQFKHFEKRPLIAGIKEFYPYFLMLDSYLFSTNEHYISGHFQYKSPFILLKRLPVLRNRLWTESLFCSYLYTPDTKNYIEPGYGIGNMLYNIGVFAGFSGPEFIQAGVRLSLKIFGTKEISF